MKDLLLGLSMSFVVVLLLAFWEVYLHPRGWLLVDSHGGETMWWGLCPNPENPTALKVWLTAVQKNYEQKYGYPPR